MKVTAWALALLTTTTAGLANADVLLLDAIAKAPPNSADGVLRPRTGAAMNQVRERFGDPAATRPAVGEPPIVRWEYPAYTVYFEQDRVINVVVHR